MNISISLPICILISIGLLIIYSSLIIISKNNYNNEIAHNNLKNDRIIKTLQEISYDYHVRIIKAGYGDLIIGGVMMHSDNVPDIEYLDMGTDNVFVNTSNETFDYSYDEDGEFYLINYRIFGRCYMTYSSGMVMSWTNVVSKARKENLKLFNGKLKI